MLNVPKNHIVLICSGDSVSDYIHGTGFLVFNNVACYVVTCRHVINEAEGCNPFAIPKLKKTTRLYGSRLNLGMPRFHPRDTDAGTFDIAAVQILDVNKQSLIENDIVPIDILHTPVVLGFHKGDQLVARGYPIDYVHAEFVKDVNEPLLPKEMRGFYYSNSLPNPGKQHDFGAPLLETFLAKTTTEHLCGDGMSGGTVRAVGSNHVVGMVLGSNKSDTFIFASINRILETINAYRLTSVRATRSRISDCHDREIGT